MHDAEIGDETFLSDVFLTVHDILNRDAAKVIDSQGDRVELDSEEFRNAWLGAFPNKAIEDSSIFPIGVIKTPNTSDVRRGFRMGEEYYTVEIHVYARRAEHCALFISKAWNALKQSEEELQQKGLYSLTHGQTTNDMTMRGEMKVHDMVMPVTVRRMRDSC